MQISGILTLMELLFYVCYIIVLFIFIEFEMLNQCEQYIEINT